MQRLSVTLLTFAITCNALFAQATKTRVPGRPGQDAHWQSAAKDAFGTATTTASKVWFTLSGGVLTEVYYPTLDVPNVQTLQLIVVDGPGVETESEDTIHRLELFDRRSLAFRQINTAKSGNYTITKRYLTDPQRNTILIDIEFKSRTAVQVYVYYDPSLNNSGMHDSAWTEGDALLAVDGDKASALVSSSGFASADTTVRDTLKLDQQSNAFQLSNGYLGTSDGLTELRRKRNQGSFAPYLRAEDGNVVQVGALNISQRSRSERDASTNRLAPLQLHCLLSLGFGKDAHEALSNARASLAKGFARTHREYVAGWHNYAARLPRVAAKYRRQFELAAMVLSALEDKTHRGAFIASPSIPWGGGVNANEATISGYHAVWSRDLYHVATALYAIGDKAAANRSLNFLFDNQQKSDGSFPQNSWLDGRPIGGGLQMDEVAFPIILANQFGRGDRDTWIKHIKPAADFIVSNGPKTGQDRWEEKSGHSPATIAAEIAGLVCAARIARVNSDELSAAGYLKTADDWAHNLHSWTATTNGPYGDGHYYLRITADANPNEGTRIEINSGGGSYDQRQIVDAGFLELVRLGIKSPDDPLVRESLVIVDKLLKINTPVGPAWYRYNHDAYGERLDGGPYDGRTGVGRLWTLLTGERGEYELARGNIRGARRLLNAMKGFANDGLMIPEQVWDRRATVAGPLQVGRGTGSATPLAWSMAQFIRLAINIQKKHNIDTPDIVAIRYKKTARKIK